MFFFFNFNFATADAEHKQYNKIVIEQILTSGCSFER